MSHTHRGKCGRWPSPIGHDRHDVLAITWTFRIAELVGATRALDVDEGDGLGTKLSFLENAYTRAQEPPFSER